MFSHQLLASRSSSCCVAIPASLLFSSFRPGQESVDLGPVAGSGGAACLSRLVSPQPSTFTASNLERKSKPHRLARRRETNDISSKAYCSRKYVQARFSFCTWQLRPIIWERVKSWILRGITCCYRSDLLIYWVDRNRTLWVE